MSSIFERMARQGHATHPGDFEDWSRLVEGIPSDQFASATTRSFEQIDPRRYAEHFHPAPGAPGPLDLLSQTQRAAVSEALFQTLAATGVSENEVLRVGLSTMNPHEMTPSDLANLAIWARDHHSAALGRAAAAVAADPDVAFSLLGPDVIVALGKALGPLPMPPHPTASDLEAARVATGPRLTVSSIPGGGTSPGGPASTPNDRSADSPATDEASPSADVGALTPPPSPLNTEPEWLTSAHPEGSWPTWAEVQPYFRSRWEAREGIEGWVWEDVESAFQFAYARYRSPEYVGHPFSDVELSLARDWDSHGSSARWGQVRAYVEDVWTTLQQRSVR